LYSPLPEQDIRDVHPFVKGDKMMKNCRSIIAVLVMIALIVVLFGCKEGPLERAGKKVDKVVEDIKK
jgi:hypothetical protein